MRPAHNVASFRRGRGGGAVTHQPKKEFGVGKIKYHPQRICRRFSPIMVNGQVVQAPYFLT